MHREYAATSAGKATASKNRKTLSFLSFLSTSCRLRKNRQNRQNKQNRSLRTALLLTVGILLTTACGLEKDRIKLKVWTSQQEASLQALKGSIARFEYRTGEYIIRLKVFPSRENLYKYFSLKAAMGKGPDVLYIPHTWLREFTDKKYLAPFPDQIAESWRAKWPPAIRKTVTVNEQAYLAPLHLGLPLLVRTSAGQQRSSPPLRLGDADYILKPFTIFSGKYNLELLRLDQLTQIIRFCRRKRRALLPDHSPEEAFSLLRRKGQNETGKALLAGTTDMLYRSRTNDTLALAGSHALVNGFTVTEKCNKKPHAYKLVRALVSPHSLRIYLKRRAAFSLHEDIEHLLPNVFPGLVAAPGTNTIQTLSPAFFQANTLAVFNRQLKRHLTAQDPARKAAAAFRRSLQKAGQQ